MKSHVFLNTAAVLLLLLLPSLFNQRGTSPTLVLGGKMRTLLQAPSCDQAPRNPPIPKKRELQNDVYIDDVRFIQRPRPGFFPKSFLAINYYARDHAWSDFWDQWPETRKSMRHDLPIIRDLGANTVRMFVPPASFGWPAVPDAAQLQRLEEALALLDEFKLRARLCLFDCWNDFGKINESKAWMEAIMRRFTNDRRIAMWELKNEVDLYNALDQPLNQPYTIVRTWVESLFPDFKRLAASKPVSISVSAAANKKNTWRKTLEDLVRLTPMDYYDVHFFPLGDITWTSQFKNDVLDAIRIVGGPERLLIHEVGQTTRGEPSEAHQRDVLWTLFNVGHAAGVQHFGVWAYQDFPDVTKICGNPVPESELGELGFGLYRLDGTAKLAVATVRDMFNGFPPTSSATPVVYNASFDDVDARTGVLEAWRSWRSDTYSGGELVHDPTRFRTGTSSARLTTIAQGVVAGFFQVPAWPVVAGQSVTAGGQVWIDNLPAGSEVRLVVSWHDKSEVYLRNMDAKGTLVTAGPTQPRDWIPLLLTATAPERAAYFQIFVHVTCPENGRFFAWFDDFTLGVSN